MKPTLLLLSALALFQCSAPQKEEITDTDSKEVAAAAEEAEAESVAEAYGDEGAPIDGFDLDAFIKDPFLLPSDCDDVVESFRKDGIAFKDTLIFGRRHLTFLDSRIEMALADENQDELTDMICHATITTDQVFFRDPVSMGMTVNDFLEKTGFSRDSLDLDEASGTKFYEYQLPFDGGYWKMSLKFESDTLRRFEYEIYPCEFEYDY